MDETKRLALQDIEVNFDCDTRIVELNFGTGEFLRELLRRGYFNVAGTGDVENFTECDVFLPNETHRIQDAEVVCSFNKKMPNPKDIPGNFFYATVLKGFESDCPIKIANMLAEAEYKDIKVRTTAYSWRDFSLPFFLAIPAAGFLNLFGVEGPRYMVKASRI